MSIATHAAEKAAARAFDLVVVAGEGILQSFGSHPRTLLVRNYPIRAQFGRQVRRQRADGEFVLGYTGNLTEARGARKMIEALGLIPESLPVRVEVFGKFWPQGLEGELRRLPGFKRVTYHGWVAYERMAAGLEDADAGLVCFLPAPNHVEAGPNKLFEYMAAGLPVIASDFPAWRPIVEGNDCGLCVDPADPAAIARAIVYLAENPGRRAEMGANGRRAVMERYNWEAEGQRLIAAYEGLTRRNSTRAP
jgi:glycosyltransferase involved in cell wall biosynthesis